MSVTIGQRIHDLLIDKDMNITELHEKTGISRSKLSMIRNDYTDTNNGKQRTLTTDELLLCAETLGVSPAFLLTGYNEENATIASDIGLSNETINRLKEMKNPLVKAVIDCLVDDWIILNHLAEYLNSDFKSVQRKSTFEFFPVSDLSGFNGDDLETVNRLRLLDDFKRIREDNKGGKAK